MGIETLDALFDEVDNTEVADAANEGETTTPEPEAEQVEEPVGEEAKTEEKPEDEPPKEEAEPVKEEATKDDWSKTAYLDEKKKRQERDARIKELESQLEGKKDIPDVFEDQEGYTQALQEKLNGQLLNQKIELSRVMMTEQHSDYEEMEAAFLDLAEKNPSLTAELQQSSLPAKFAYETAKAHQELQQIKDGSYKAKLMAEIREELKAEMVQEQSKKAETASRIKSSLAKETASTSDKKPTFKTLDDIFG